MRFFNKRFPAEGFTLYPIGDLHYGSAQCDLSFVKRVVAEIKDNPNAYWVGMGDLIENAIVGSKSDVYTQTVQPRDQIAHIVELFRPVAEKGLFLIGGNHERRTTRQAGIVLEEHIAVQLGVPYKGFSCIAYFQTESSHTPHDFVCYFHHNYGGGYTPGGKVNRAESLRRIVPTADAIFSGHFHITSRIPVTWHEAGRKKALRKTGYDYITGSALTWNESYAEEKAKPAASVEFIKVTFIGGSSGKGDSRKQIYETISP